jgi:hypothetical protein
MSYVYKQTEKHEFGGLWTVGFYDPSGKWEPESDHDAPNKAAQRVAYLNGRNPSLDEALNSGDGSYRP